MKTIKITLVLVFAIVLTIVVLSSCESRSKVIRPVVTEEKAVIIETNNQASAFHGEEVLTYKVKRLSTSTVTFIQIKVTMIYSVNDTILWKF